MSHHRDPLTYHASFPSGKVGVHLTKPFNSLADLAVASEPGVSSPANVIAASPDKVYAYTGKGNLVAMISNGTSVLGLGNIGPLAVKPVMEGKAMEVKALAGLNCFDLEIDEEDPQRLVEIIASLAPTFGAINLEDIKAPDCFEVERALMERLAIPVIHSDQHGISIAVAAALKNALWLVEKDFKKVKVVIHGAGAAGLSNAQLLHEMGVRKENIVILDSKGVVRADRKDLSIYKASFATKRDITSLDEAMEGADVFIGLSVGSILKPSHVSMMAENPIIFALANPTPEIDPLLAKRTRSDVIVGTGRPDYPNQVSSVLVFPYLLRGLMDVQASQLTERVKHAAIDALASLGREPIRKGDATMPCRKDCLLPHALDPRLLMTIPVAVAKMAMEEKIAKKPITDWGQYQKLLKQYGERKS